MSSQKMELVKIIEDAAKEIYQNGQEVFTRLDIIRLINAKFNFPEGTIRPMIQKMTINLKSDDKDVPENIFLNIERGKFILLNKKNFKKYIGKINEK
jgi:hypothetical protein